MIKSKEYLSKSFTSRGDSLSQYLQEVDKIERLSKKEEIILGLKIKRGDPEAVNEMCRRNLRFVIKVAKSYQNNGLSLHDLINEGNLGLKVAAQKFDVDLGNKFITFAVVWIRQSILKALDESSRTVRLPQHKITEKNKVQKSIRVFEQENERYPHIDELVEDTKLSQFKVVEALSGLCKCTSYDFPVNDNVEGTLLDVLQNDDSPDPEHLLMLSYLSMEIRRILKILKEEERKIILLRYGIGLDRAHTTEEIGALLSMTQKQVGKKIHTAVQKLKKADGINYLRMYIS